MGEEEFRRMPFRGLIARWDSSHVHASALDMSETVILHTLGLLQINGARMVHFV